jgi:hypothetical protein
MQILFKFGIIWCAIVLAHVAGCSLNNTASVLNAVEKESSNDMKLQKVAQENDGKIIKEEGWTIPKPEKQKLVRISNTDSRLESGGKVKVTTTDYSPVKDFLTEEPIVSMGKGHVYGVTKIDLIRESKVNNKSFCYTVFVSSVKVGEKAGKSWPTGSPFLYQYIDRDGDGKFETLLTDASKFAVPDWLSQANQR